MKIISLPQLIGQSGTKNVPQIIAKSYHKIFYQYYNSIDSCYTKRILNVLTPNVFEKYWEDYIEHEQNKKRGYNSLVLIENDKVVGISSTLPVCRNISESLKLKAPEKTAKLDKIYLCESLRGQCLWQNCNVETS